jgi:hypothetical protein
MTQELLGRVHRELLDVLKSINQDEIHDDGHDFHKLLKDVEKALAQPEQEPEVDLRTRWPMNGWKENKSTPPQRKPLTLHQINKALISICYDGSAPTSTDDPEFVELIVPLARAIEAAHDIKEHT